MEKTLRQKLLMAEKEDSIISMQLSTLRKRKTLKRKESEYGTLSDLSFPSSTSYESTEKLINRARTASRASATKYLDAGIFYTDVHQQEQVKDIYAELGVVISSQGDSEPVVYSDVTALDENATSFIYDLTREAVANGAVAEHESLADAAAAVAAAEDESRTAESAAADAAAARFRDKNATSNQRRLSSVGELPPSPQAVPDYTMSERLVVGTMVSVLVSNNPDKHLKELRIRKMALCGQIGLAQDTLKTLEPGSAGETHLRSIYQALRDQLTRLDGAIAAASLQATESGGGGRRTLISLKELSNTLSRSATGTVRGSVKAVRKRTADAAGAADAAAADNASNNSNSYNSSKEDDSDEPMTKEESVASIRALCHELAFAVSATLKTETMETSLAVYTQMIEECLTTLLAVSTVCKSLLIDNMETRESVLNSVTAMRRSVLLALRVSKDLRNAALAAKAGLPTMEPVDSKAEQQQLSCRSLATAIRQLLTTLSSI